MKGKLLLLLLLVLLQACGYQLRGMGAESILRSDIGSLYIAGLTEQSDFERTLISSLNDQGISVVSEREQASSILRMTNPVSSSRLVSVNKLAQGVDYSLFMRSKISLKSAAGTDLIKDRQIEVRRDLVADPDDALGNDQLEQETKLELEQALVNALLLQLRAR